MSEEELPVLLNASGVASLLGVSRQRVHQLRREGKLPAPVAWINYTHRAWSPSQFENLEVYSEASAGNGDYVRPEETPLARDSVK